MTNAQIAQLPFFVSACKEMGIEPSARQARKCKQGAGRWKNHALTACLNNIRVAA